MGSEKRRARTRRYRRVDRLKRKGRGGYRKHIERGGRSGQVRAKRLKEKSIR